MRSDPSFSKVPRQKSVRIKQTPETTEQLGVNVENNNHKKGMSAMEKFILGLFVVVVIAVGLSADGSLLMNGNQDGWSPRAYVPANGDCFVPPQGDPLYDEHYSGINVNNCNAFKVQSQARYIDAQTESVQVETRTGIFGVLSIFGVVAAVVVLLVIAIFK